MFKKFFKKKNTEEETEKNTLDSKASLNPHDIDDETTVSEVNEEVFNQTKILFHESLVNAMLDSVVVISATGNIIDWNPACCKMFGYTKAEMLGKNVSKLMPDEYARKHDLFLRNYINTGVAKIIGAEREVICKRKDGTTFHAELSVSEFRTQVDIFFVGLLKDIDERIRTQRKVEEAVKKSEEATKTKGRFLASVSHELRTPLNSVIGMSEVLIETQLDPDQEKYAGTILSSGKKLLSLINDILDVSKIEANEMIIENIPVNLKDVVGEVIEMLAIKAFDKSIDILYHVDPKISHLVISDPIRLNQVLVNLVNNAIKFTEEGEVIITIKEVNNGEGIQFIVSDSGIGIAEDKQDKIFESFSQAEESTTRNYGGTGLGLQISKALVELMGGSLNVNSKLGVGSRFYFTLKMDKAEKIEMNSFQLNKKFLFIVDSSAKKSLLKNISVENNMSSSVLSIKEAVDLLKKGRLSPDIYVVVLASEKQDQDLKLFQFLKEKAVSPSRIIFGLRINGLNHRKVIAKKLGILHTFDLPLIYHPFLKTLESVTNLKEVHDKPSAHTSVKKKILIVDDDPKILDLISLQLEDPAIELYSETDPLKATKLLFEIQFDLVLSDYNMPNINGEGVFKIFESTQSQNSVFILISGDINHVPRAVSRRAVFISKPLKLIELKRIIFDSLQISPKGESVKPSRISSDVPIITEKEVDSPIEASPTSPVSSMPATPQRKFNLLIVDDAEENRDLLLAYLKKVENISISQADNGKSALDLILTQDFDLALVDIQMPVMDGVTLIKHVKSSHKKELKMYALTANVYDEERKLAEEAGCDAYLSKPISKKKVLDIVTELMEKK